MLDLDTVTKQEFYAGLTASARAQAVLTALADPVTVTVYDGSGNAVGSGTMSAPWATINSNILTLGQLSSFSVTSTGTPDPATWTIRFSSGSRWAEGSFGLTGSGADFVWSVATWESGQNGQFGSSTAYAWKGSVEKEVYDHFDLQEAPLPQVSWINTNDQLLGAITAGVGSSYDLKPYATIPSGTTPKFEITSTPVAGIVVEENTGILNVSSSVPAGTYNIDVDLEPFVLFEPNIIGEEQPEQYRTIDDLGDTAGEKIGGITAYDFYERLRLRWRNTMGDYTGHSGTLPTIGTDVSQGGSPFSQGSVSSGVGLKTFDATELVRRAVTTGRNKGFFLRMTGTNGPSVTWAGRLSANPPSLTVVTSTNTFNCPCRLSTRMGTDTDYPINGTTSFTNSTSRNGVLQFDLSGVTGTVTSATLTLYANALFGSNRVLQLFELDPPTFQLGAGTADTTYMTTDGKTGVPTGQIALGIAAELGEVNLAAADGAPLHPDIYCAGHFEGTTFAGGNANAPRIRGFDTIDYDNTVQIVPDPDAPGTSYWRGTAVNVVAGSTNRGLFKQFYDFTPALTTDSRYPIDVSKRVDEIYVRAYFMFEPDWLDKDEGIKAMLGIRAQFGVWMNSGNAWGGYWEPEGGNSNSYGDGMKHFQDCHDGGGTAYAPPETAANPSYYMHHGSPNRDNPLSPGYDPDDAWDYAVANRFVYKGHMQFNLCGYTGRTLQYDGIQDPHWDVRRLSGYNYNLDAPNVYGQGQSTLGNIINARVRLGKWFCLEQYMKMNTVDTSRPIYGLKDGSFYDNYEANPDGVHRTWLNGVLIDEKTNFRWRRNMDIGIQGAGIEFYTGGNGVTNWPVPGHFRVSHVVVSKRYIGPRMRP